MRRVILETPYQGDIDANVAYARACMRDSLQRNEAPIASHLLYPQPGILRDEKPDERQWGIDAGLVWGAVAEATIVYVDRGVSRGMQFGIDNAKKAGRPVEFRSLEANSTAIYSAMKLDDIPDYTRREGFVGAQLTGTGLG